MEQPFRGIASRITPGRVKRKARRGYTEKIGYTIIDGYTWRKP